jgi:hypothetical protein
MGLRHMAAWEPTSRGGGAKGAIVDAEPRGSIGAQLSKRRSTTEKLKTSVGQYNFQ